MLTIPAGILERGFVIVLLVDAVLILLTLLSDLEVGFAVTGPARQLDLKLESNFAVWYSSLLLQLAGIGAFCVGQRVRRAQASASSPILWRLAGVFFVALSIDETAILHEKVGVRFDRHFGVVPGLTDGAAPAFAWLLALLPLIALFVACMLAAARQIAALNRRSRTLLLAGLACWIGVLVAEFTQSYLQRAGAGRSFQGAIEEGLEILGTTLFLFAFASFCRSPAQRAAPAGSAGAHAGREPE